jgi:hypothetical protein
MNACDHCFLPGHCCKRLRLTLNDQATTGCRRSRELYKSWLDEGQK